MNSSPAPDSGGDRRILPAFRPEQAEQLPPCQFNCPMSGLIRTWIGIVAQRRKTGLSDEQAFDQAWSIIASRNPFPATLGRICPHECESACNRATLDDAVSIRAMERFLGDWAIQRSLPLPLVERSCQPESVGVIGAGPSGLSFAYQMARRGYAVLVYESKAQPGGMLRYAVPEYRLPTAVLDAEIQRIVDVGIGLRLSTAIGRDVKLEGLRKRHDILYAGIGAQRGRYLGFGEDALPDTWRGIEYLEAVKSGRRVDLGTRVAVIGGGNTAIDVARTARRGGAHVTLVYRRSRDEMPANAHEVVEAEEEGVDFHFLISPVGVERGPYGGLVLRGAKMELGDPDESGRRAAAPIPGMGVEIAVDSVIAAVSQEPVWDGLSDLLEDGRLVVGPGGQIDANVWVGGDMTHLGLAGDAIVQGRIAAETVHAHLRGLTEPRQHRPSPIGPDGIVFGFYPPASRTVPERSQPAARLLQPHLEVSQGIAREQFLQEAARCLSCGSCFGCEQCFMFCNAQCFTRVEEVGPGAYFSLSLNACEECGKCVEICPCGFLQLDGSRQLGCDLLARRADEDP